MKMNIITGKLTVTAKDKANLARGYFRTNPRTVNLATEHNPKPWVIVNKAGTDEESIWSDHATYSEALRNTMTCPELWDIMVRREDGTLTTEF